MDVDTIQKAMVTVIDPSPKKITKLLQPRSSCLKSVLPNVANVTFKQFRGAVKDDGLKGRMWYLAIQGKYIVCQTMNATDEIGPDDTLGGEGVKKKWFTILVARSVKASVNPSEMTSFF